jgi:hypothetical protein
MTLDMLASWAVAATRIARSARSTKPEARTPLRIRVVGTQLPGRACGGTRDIQVGLQVGKLVEQSVAADVARAVFEADVTLVGGDLRGKAIHGKRGERFLYLSWAGVAAGARDAAMFRRAKLQLDAVPAKLLAEAVARGVLEAELPLTDEKGMPRCASVRPPRITWRASSR